MFPAVIIGTAAYVLSQDQTSETNGHFDESAVQQMLPMPDGGKQTRENEVKFSDIKYERPDTELIRAAIEKLESQLQNENSNEVDLIGQYKEIVAMYDSIDTQSSIAYVLYSEDVTEPYYQGEYEYLEGEMKEIDLLLTDLTINMIENEETADAMTEAFDEAYLKNVYAKQKRNSKTIQEDVKADLALASEYDTLLTTFVMKDGNKSYTMDDLLNLEVNTTEDYENYLRLIKLYYDQLNQQAGKIFLQLVQVRSSIATKLGYSSYSEYCYEDFGRDYSTEEIKKLHAAVKEYIVPLYVKSYFRFYYMSDAYSALQGLNYDYPTFMNKFQSIIEEFSPEMQEAFDAMIRNDLISTDVSEKKMETSYTTYFADYKTPYIFTQWENLNDSSRTLIHEFGHFSNFYINPVYGWNVLDPLDIEEVDSQGLEMLMLQNYPFFFGASRADSYKTVKILDALYSLISGCMEDEFQQIVYANPHMTLDEMNACYKNLSEEYGFTSLFEYGGKEWAAIPHTFQSPLYYISYATSMVAALEIWEESLSDYSEAKADYLALQNRPAYSEFRQQVIGCGLSDPISEKTIQLLAETIDNQLEHLF